VGTLTVHNIIGLHGLLQGQIYMTTINIIIKGIIVINVIIIIIIIIIIVITIYIL
jgi:hypothetical protein